MSSSADENIPCAVLCTDDNGVKGLRKWRQSCSERVMYINQTCVMHSVFFSDISSIYSSVLAKNILQTDSSTRTQKGAFFLLLVKEENKDLCIFSE